ncbi:MAG: DUF1570 domain-containing protein, partial [Thermoguttaceae bacterium]|nr:DUF1570 domain-containing protein [Thermoguttaceae bacterium]
FFWSGASGLLSRDDVFGANEPQTNDRTVVKTTTWDEKFLESTANELREEIDAFFREIGSSSSARVKVSERFIFVYDVSDAYVEWLAALLNEVAKAFDKFVDKLELEVDELREPMTVAVFATREEFDAYAVKLRGPGYMNQERKPAGFYSQRLNRSIVYDHTGVEAFRTEDESTGGRSYSRKRINEEARSIKARDNAESNTTTLVHEATHQLCYNYGLFSFDFRAPDWVVEGLAMTFEQTTPEAPLGWRFRNVFPLNVNRLEAFRRYARENPDCAILDEILASDAFAERLDADGYAASWALFYYCYRKKPKELANYLKTIAGKKPFSRYPERERLDDFTDAFGPIPEFGVDFAKYMRSL